MRARDTLHRLIDELPEEDLSTAERVLQGLRATAAPQVPPDQAPVDQKPDDDDFDGGLTEARADLESDRVVSHEEAKRGWQRLHAKITEFAPEQGGSALDLDEDLEQAAIEVLKATDRPVLT